MRINAVIDNDALLAKFSETAYFNYRSGRQGLTFGTRTVNQSKHRCLSCKHEHFFIRLKVGFSFCVMNYRNKRVDILKKYPVSKHIQSSGYINIDWYFLEGQRHSHTENTRYCQATIGDEISFANFKRDKVMLSLPYPLHAIERGGRGVDCFVLRSYPHLRTTSQQLCRGL